MSESPRSPRPTSAVARSSTCGSRRCTQVERNPSRGPASTRCASARSSSAGRRPPIAVVDEDIGRSGASSEGRVGFKELVAEVGLGKVGVVLALEVSRLARSSADWHQLLDLCALTATLIADSDGIYSTADFNDRMLLGLKGTMSEAELHLIRARLNGGVRNKAERGELEQRLPVGLDRDEGGAIVLCRRRAGAPGDRVTSSRCWRAARLRAPGRRRAGRRGTEAAAPHGRPEAGPLGPAELRRRARLPHQPRLRRRLRLRPHPHREVAR